MNKNEKNTGITEDGDFSAIISKHTKVKIFFGNNSVAENGAQISALGKKAFIVSGKNAADKSGAIGEVKKVLDSLGISFVRFTEITENPLATVCRKGGEICRSEGCDFVIGIGGGSAIDAAKAIAGYAANPECDVLDIFDDCKRKNDCLPIVAIPTTAGTGTEACRYSVLTIDGGEKKKTFKHSSAYPALSFVSPCFSETMSERYTVSTALDAFAHAIESYLSPKSTENSEEAALYAAKLIWKNIFESETLTKEGREELSRAACAAGIAIDYTGTGFPHPLGYSITLSRNIPHGEACAVFEGAFIRYNMLTEIGAEKLGKFAEHIGTTIEELEKRIPEKSGVSLTIPKDEQVELVERVAGAGNYANSPYVISQGEMEDIYERLFCEY